MGATYILIMFCEKEFRTVVGSLGEIDFKKGWYYYVGSARSGVHRIRRHFTGKKRIRWHIDYISSKMHVLGAVMVGEGECNVARKFENFERVKGFGCSDCRCESHLFYSPSLTLEFLSA